MNPLRQRFVAGLLGLGLAGISLCSSPTRAVAEGPVGRPPRLEAAGESLAWGALALWLQADPALVQAVAPSAMPAPPAEPPAQPVLPPVLPEPPPETPPPLTLTPAEAEFLLLINQERAAAGLAPLLLDLRLVATARAKSADMIAQGYFGHTSPTLGSAFDQMEAAGITYRTAAENLAGGPTVAKAHRTLMESPSHRANLLNPALTKIGVGVVSGGPYGLMITQHLIGD